MPFLCPDKTRWYKLSCTRCCNSLLDKLQKKQDSTISRLNTLHCAVWSTNCLSSLTTLFPSSSRVLLKYIPFLYNFVIPLITASWLSSWCGLRYVVTRLFLRFFEDVHAIHFFVTSALQNISINFDFALTVYLCTKYFPSYRNLVLPWSVQTFLAYIWSPPLFVCLCACLFCV